MGIKRTVEWKLRCSPPEAESRLRQALQDMDLPDDGEPGVIRASVKRSLIRNRWAAEVEIQLEPLAGETLATTRVEMNGTKHYDLLNEFAGKIGDDLFDDRGATEAIERLGKVGRIFGRKEIRHLQHLLHGDERVLTLGQGKWGDKQGIVVLTTERLFLFEKHLTIHESLEEFSLESIGSIETGKKRSGERLVIHAYGTSTEVTNLFHGHADEIARQFRRLRSHAPDDTATRSLSPDAAPASTDHVATLKSLAELRDQGILTPEEFEQKKAEILERL